MKKNEANNKIVKKNKEKNAIDTLITSFTHELQDKLKKYNSTNAFFEEKKVEKINAEKNYEDENKKLTELTSKLSSNQLQLSNLKAKI